MLVGSVLIALFVFFSISCYRLESHDPPPRTAILIPDLTATALALLVE